MPLSTVQNMVWDLSEVVLPKWTLTADYTEQIKTVPWSMLAPYGDDPIDQYWIKRGYNY